MNEPLENIFIPLEFTTGMWQSLLEIHSLLDYGTWRELVLHLNQPLHLADEESGAWGAMTQPRSCRELRAEPACWLPAQCSFFSLLCRSSWASGLVPLTSPEPGDPEKLHFLRTSLRLWAPIQAQANGAFLLSSPLTVPWTAEAWSCQWNCVYILFSGADRSEVLRGQKSSSRWQGWDRVYVWKSRP